MKNQPGFMKKQPWTSKTNLEPWKSKTNLNPWKSVITDMEPWKTNLQPSKLTRSCTGWLWVVTGGYRRLPGGSDHFSLQTNRYFIIIYIYHHHQYVRHYHYRRNFHQHQTRPEATTRWASVIVIRKLISNGFPHLILHPTRALSVICNITYIPARKKTIKKFQRICRPTNGWFEEHLFLLPEVFGAGGWKWGKIAFITRFLRNM